MPDTNDQSISNPQTLVDAALGTTPEATPITPPPLEPLNAMPPTPTLTPTPAPTPIANPVQPLSSPSVAMGDDTPLAFAIPAPSSEPTSIATPNIPSMPVNEPPKAKSKTGIVIGGILLLLVSVVGGLWGYANLPAKTGQVAKLTEQIDSTHTITQTVKQEKDSQQDFEKTGQLNERGTVTDTETGRMTTEKYMPTGLPAKPGATDCDSGFKYSGAGSKECVPPEVVTQYYITNHLTIPGPLTDADCKILRTNNWDKDKTVTGTNADTGGLCYGGKCTAPEGCSVEKVFCNAGGQSGVACNENIVSKGNSATVDNDLACGSQQLDVICKQCGSKPVAFANKLTGVSCKTEKVTNDAVAPTLTCTDLSHAPAGVPAIGANLLFTCTGASKPVGAIALTYNYRYQINAGAWTAMAVNTANPPKGMLTIAACGEYKVQCRACGTINGTKVCSPVWAGATQ